MATIMMGTTSNPRTTHDTRPRLVSRAISLVSPRTWAMAPKRVTIPLVPGSSTLMYPAAVVKMPHAPNMAMPTLEMMTGVRTNPMPTTTNWPTVMMAELARIRPPRCSAPRRMSGSDSPGSAPSLTRSSSHRAGETTLL